MSKLCHLPSELQAGRKNVKRLGYVMYKLLASVCREHKNEYVCVYGFTTVPCGPSVMWPSHVSVQGPWTQHRGNLIPQTKKRNRRKEGVREKKKG